MKRKHKNMAAISQSAYEVARAKRAQYESEATIVSVLMARGLSEQEAQFVVKEVSQDDKKHASDLDRALHRDHALRSMLYSAVGAGIAFATSQLAPNTVCFVPALFLLAIFGLGFMRGALLWLVDAF